jgi:hypothetical protein
MKELNVMSLKRNEPARKVGRDNHLDDFSISGETIEQLSDAHSVKEGNVLSDHVAQDERAQAARTSRRSDGIQHLSAKCIGMCEDIRACGPFLAARVPSSGKMRGGMTIDLLKQRRHQGLKIACSRSTGRERGDWTGEVTVALARGEGAREGSTGTYGCEQGEKAVRDVDAQQHKRERSKRALAGLEGVVVHLDSLL